MTIQEKIESLKELIDISLKETIKKHPNVNEAEMAFANALVEEMLSISYKVELSASSILQNSFGIVLPEKLKDEVQNMVTDIFGR